MPGPSASTLFQVPSAPPRTQGRCGQSVPSVARAPGAPTSPPASSASNRARSSSPPRVSGAGLFPPPRTAVPIPDGLTMTPPGAELAGLLAEVNVELVSGFDTVEVLKEAYRQVCHDRAWFLRTLLEVGLRDSFSGDDVVRLEV